MCSFVFVCQWEQHIATNEYGLIREQMHLRIYRSRLILLSIKTCTRQVWVIGSANNKRKRERCCSRVCGWPTAKLWDFEHTETRYTMALLYALIVILVTTAMSLPPVIRIGESKFIETYNHVNGFQNYMLHEIYEILNFCVFIHGLLRWICRQALSFTINYNQLDGRKRTNRSFDRLTLPLTN